MVFSDLKNEFLVAQYFASYKTYVTEQFQIFFLFKTHLGFLKGLPYSMLPTRLPFYDSLTFW